MPVSQAQFVEFTLTQVDEQGEDSATLYTSRFAVTGEAGIVSLQLPETASLPPAGGGRSLSLAGRRFFAIPTVTMAIYKLKGGCNINPLRRSWQRH